MGLRSSSATVRFTPRRQALHDKSTFEVTVHDPRGIPDDYVIRVRYNGLDVSSQFLSNADITWIDMSHKYLRISTKNLRLLADRDHDIEVAYLRNDKSDAIVAEYLPPNCQPFEAQRRIASVPRFEASREIIQTINAQSTSRKFNPYLIAALIAGESSFNSRAVSNQKAIGLTQITSLGEAEVIKQKDSWPRYSGIDEMSPLTVRLGILRGTINETNEWRLNPNLSIEGGVEYMSYLTDYWGKADKKALLEKQLADGIVSSEVLLASYNSGPARVTRALERGGKDWLADEELVEARKYVRKVVSYCDHFVDEGDVR